LATGSYKWQAARKSVILNFESNAGGLTVITLDAQGRRSNGRLSAHILHYTKGTPIYCEGDPAKHWFEVVSGIVRTCRFHADGRRQLTGFFYSGDVFGLDVAFHAEAAEAVTDITLSRHARTLPEARSQTDPEAAEFALRRALDSAQRCIFLLGRKTATERVAAFLIAVTHRLEDHEQIELPMSRSDIADHLGLTIHTVSRTISDLVRRRIIALDGPQHVRIIDRDRLRDLTGESGSEELWARQATHAAGEAA
jgi:CRP-like cAMP-binding protein